MEVEWKGVKLETLQRNLGYSNKIITDDRSEALLRSKASVWSSLHPEVCAQAKSVTHNYKSKNMLGQSSKEVENGNNISKGYLKSPRKQCNNQTFSWYKSV